MEHRTTMQIENKTLMRLSELKLTKRETYDELINRIIEESIMVRDEYKIFKVKSKLIEIPENGNLILEVPGVDQEELSQFKEEIYKRISEDKKTIIITGKEIKIPRRTYIRHEKEIKGELREKIMNIPKQKRNKLFDLKDIKKSIK